MDDEQDVPLSRQEADELVFAAETAEWWEELERQEKAARPV